MPHKAQSCSAELIILGAGQDAGAPQIGNSDDPGWNNPKLNLTPTSAALIDHDNDRRYLFEATPQITAQLHYLDQLAPTQSEGLGLAGVFITHAHIGHYAGLMFFGREAAGTKMIPVFVMPRMAEFLQENGPWSQLISLGNIDVTLLEDSESQDLRSGLTVTPLLVPHRDEYSETVGFIISGTDKSALFLPDIDDWSRWKSDYQRDVREIIGRVDFAFIDATFYDDNELPGRDMSLIPHPRVSGSMDRLSGLEERVYFIHYNHTNPIREQNSAQSREVAARGFSIARAGDRFCLSK